MTGARAIVAILGLALSGCVTWPEGGTGGMAELSAPLYGGELASARSRLERLKDGGATRHLPAHVLIAERWAVRVSRELAGGLPGDALISLVAFHETLDEIEDRLGSGLETPDQTILSAISRPGS